MRIADAAMYEAKRAGKGRVCFGVNTVANVVTRASPEAHQQQAAAD
jgi:hypothetical protein